MRVHPTRLDEVLTIALSLTCGLASACRAQPADLDKKCEYGVTLALSGELEAAEGVFVSLLSVNPGDPRAYVNLGNIHLLRGGFETAIRFYDRALEKDTTDAGIFLNRSTAHLAMGHEEEALRDAAHGIELAGDANAAADLVGLKLQASPPSQSKASEQTVMMKDEVRALLALAATPPDSSSTSTGTSSEANEAGDDRRKKRLRVWHTSGPRAAESSDAASVLYWKRSYRID